MSTKILLSLMAFLFSLNPVRIPTDEKRRTITGVVTDAGDGYPLAGVRVTVNGTSLETQTNTAGKYRITFPERHRKLTFTHAGYLRQEAHAGRDSVLHLKMTADPIQLMEVTVTGSNIQQKRDFSMMSGAAAAPGMPYVRPGIAHETENYNPINENGFQATALSPVTTFSADVDRASYSNVRRFINTGQLPPVDAVRIEEMINYFDYSYAPPAGEHPISVSAEISDSPWNKGLKLVHIGLRARSVPSENLPASNLVFLIDVSGSMMSENKLPLLKRAFKLLTDQLRDKDRVSIVVYAGAAGLVLPSTPGSEKRKIMDALDWLEAGGSTAGAGGIRLAYQTAADHFLENGNNRVILATDGDFNVGVSSEGELQRLIEEKRKSGIYLSVLGFGTGNYKDSHAEILADKGNGNYAYIDNIQEARKVFIHEFAGTLFTVADDVKLQLEFNPEHVRAYRLIGYENRALKNEEFNDDRKDAGEMGSGHSVTALYEIIPAGTESSYMPAVDALKYGKTAPVGKSGELLTLKIRYKNPGQESSRLMEIPVRNVSRPLSACSENFRFAAAVAEFGLLLRNSDFKGTAGYDEVIARAKQATGKDKEGYRAEFVRLAATAKLLDTRKDVAVKDE